MRRCGPARKVDNADPVTQRSSMRALASLVIVTVLGGCNVRQKVAAGGLTVTVVGLGLTYSGRDRTEASTASNVGLAMLLVGLVTMFTAAALEESAAEESATKFHTPRPRPAPAATPAATRPRDEAWQHTQAAQAAARAGDCARVTELSAQVGALDAELFADVFMKDPAIQACFTAPPSAEPAAPAPEAAPAPASPAPAPPAPVDVPGVPVPVPVPAPAP